MAIALLGGISGYCLLHKIWNGYFISTELRGCGFANKALAMPVCQGAAAGHGCLVSLSPGNRTVPDPAHWQAAPSHKHRKKRQ